MLVRRGRLPGEAAFVAGKLACLADDARSDARDRWAAEWQAARQIAFGTGSADLTEGEGFLVRLASPSVLIVGPDRRLDAKGRMLGDHL
jgi:hypothetical protein